MRNYLSRSDIYSPWPVIHASHKELQQSHSFGKCEDLQKKQAEYVYLNHPSLSKASFVASALLRYSLKTPGPFTRSSPVLLSEFAQAQGIIRAGMLVICTSCRNTNGRSLCKSNIQRTL